MAPETNDPPAPPPSPQCTASTGQQADNSVDQVCNRYYGYGDLPRVKGSPIPAEDYAAGQSYECMTQTIDGVVKEDNEDTHVAPLHKRKSSNRLRHFGQQAKRSKIAQAAEDCNTPTDESDEMDIHQHKFAGQNAEIEVDSDEDGQEDEDWYDRVMKQVRRAG
ncbi:hypothetical protein LTR70_009506 [Exophiala xenobiotica]|uniref:Uncharacterized protein n=1 Tax=Lithohypha guttulata TaxID=1690604 RepID=A0ABR0JX21_9EURO|nr:hypothetical protein LTR24_009416 [Lithohypha guttulata]KAK5310400.1 hypothetical protein LTR70_009506 [Exophiala xenobiotica]